MEPKYGVLLFLVIRNCTKARNPFIINELYDSRFKCLKLQQFSLSNPFFFV